VLLRIPDFRDRDFRIFHPILKKGFESDPDLSDPNPQIPHKKIRYSSYNSRRTDKRAKKHLNLKQKKLCQKSPKFAKFQAILGAFYLATKIWILALKILIFFLPQRRAKESDLWIPIPGSVTTLHCSITVTVRSQFSHQSFEMSLKSVDFECFPPKKILTCSGCLCDCRIKDFSAGTVVWGLEAERKKSANNLANRESTMAKKNNNRIS
jgi:hypothetical protein